MVKCLSASLRLRVSATKNDSGAISNRTGSPSCAGYGNWKPACMACAAWRQRSRPAGGDYYQQMDWDAGSCSSIRGRREWQGWELPPGPLYILKDRASSAYNLFRTLRPARLHHQENIGGGGEQG